jgi:hypothetical protein
MSIQESMGLALAYWATRHTTPLTHTAYLTQKGKPHLRLHK